MNSKKKITLLGVILFLLVLCIFILVFVSSKKSNIKSDAAIKFVDKLYENNMIDLEYKDNNDKYKTINKGEELESRGAYTVVSSDFSIEVDENNNIISFVINNIEKGKQNIDSDEALDIAKRYLTCLTDKEYLYSSLVVDSKETNYYSFMFSKMKDGYAFYSDHIVININKTTGYLDGYTNINIQHDPKECEIVISEDKAKDNAIEYFNKTNTSGTINQEIQKAYCDNNENTKTELCYVVIVEGNDMNNKQVMMKYFISTKSGKVINQVNETITETQSDN